MEERKNCGEEKRRERGERRESSKCADSCKAMSVGGAEERGGTGHETFARSEHVHVTAADTGDNKTCVSLSDHNARAPTEYTRPWARSKWFLMCISEKASSHELLFS